MSGVHPGDIVDIEIKGVHVIGINALTGAPTIVDDNGDEFPMPPQATVEHTKPSEWPPRRGDVWRDRYGALWFGVGYTPDDVALCAHDGRGEKFIDAVRHQQGPLTLVHREGAES